MKYAVRLLIVTGSALTAVFIIFLIAEILLIHRRSQAAALKTPYYQWSMYTADGTRVGEERGPLQLVLRPFIVFGNRPNQRTPEFSTDSRGFRTTSVPPRITRRGSIVVIGGSAAFGTGLGSDGETFESQLGQLLGIRVVNAAVIGHESGQELAYLVTELVDLRPSLVMTLDGWNDYGFRPRDSSLLGVAGYEQVEWRIRILQLLLHPPSLSLKAAQLPLILFPQTGQWLLARIFSRMAAGTGGGGSKRTIPEAAMTYSANIEKMNRLSAAFGSRFLCVIQATKRSSEFQMVNEHYDSFRAIATAELRRANVALLDVNVPAYEERLAESRFVDLMHLDAAGNRMLAEILAQKIAEMDLLADKPLQVDDTPY